MPKYLLTVNYTPEGAKMMHADGGTKRRAAAEAAIKSLGGHIESFYFSFGHSDVVCVVDMPDRVSMAAASISITQSGVAETSTHPLLTAEEMDQACKKNVNYHPQTH